MKSLVTTCLLVLALAVTSTQAAPAAAPVNVNTADARTLDQGLLGVSPKTAAAIIEYRSKHGPFKSADELTKVKGVGKKTVERNRSRIVLGDKTPVAAKNGSAGAPATP